MSFVRPGARAAIWRWREVIAGVAVILVGVHWGYWSFGVLQSLGVALFFVGLAFVAAALRRALVRPRQGGAGVIELDERRLSFLHPDHGVILDLPDVTRIEIETTGDGPTEPDLFWVFTHAGGRRARIPANALGADLLVDALASFPGADYKGVITASGTTVPQHFVIWQKARPTLH
ncbi:MAG: hypothetical protein CSA70_00560 [Rhodobacterales bacterium]|nr:MAG: hypothetical protein CSA70_00560 [Rhodobacterales bacterium]